jgi:hypothetical protein
VQTTRHLTPIGHCALPSQLLPATTFDQQTSSLMIPLKLVALTVQSPAETLSKILAAHKEYISWTNQWQMAIYCDRKTFTINISIYNDSLIQTMN